MSALVLLGTLKVGDTFEDCAPGSNGGEYVVSANEGGVNVYAYPSYDQDCDDPIEFFADEQVRFVK